VGKELRWATGVGHHPAKGGWGGRTFLEMKTTRISREAKKGVGRKGKSGSVGLPGRLESVPAHWSLRPGNGSPRGGGEHERRDSTQGGGLVGSKDVPVGNATSHHLEWSSSKNLGGR